MGPSASLIRERAEELGFDLVGFGPADPGEHAAHYLAWLEAGRAGEMAWMERTRDVLVDPQRYASGARTTISLAFDYGGPEDVVRLPGPGGRVARYAVGRDYHRALGKRVRNLREFLTAEGVQGDQLRGGTDALPLLERALSVRAGVGFLARSAGVISPTHGPYLLLAELLTPQDLPLDLPAPGSCGTCTRCLDACPTDAIVAPFEVDARRCLSYTTIELRGPIPEELREPQEDRLFGCDVCLDVCPFTSARHGRAARGTTPTGDLAPHRVVESFTLVDVLELDAETYERDWVGTPMRRAKRNGLRRNAAIALGNLGDDGAVPALARSLADEDPIVRSHASWALGRLAPDSRELAAALEREQDPLVRAEMAAARDRGRPRLDG
jgi:epoxyqueuosine reductase